MPGSLQWPHMRRVLVILAWALAAVSSGVGCRTAREWPAIDTAEPGWQVLEGQAVWRARRGAVELAGELLLARHPDGRALVQFTKTPISFVTARLKSASWRIEFPAQHRVCEGPGAPPARFGWLLVPGFMGGTSPAGGWQFRRLEGSGFVLEHPGTGERIDGHLGP